MRFVDEEVRKLTPSKPADFVKLIAFMCGRATSVEPSEESFLKEILAGSPALNYEQFNEVLLVLNQERVSARFFDFFFHEGTSRGPVSLQALKRGIEKFRGFAMLEYGNFRHAYQRLSSLRTPAEEFERAVKRHCMPSSTEMRRRFLARPRKTLRIHPIDRNLTWLTGYLSAGKYSQDSATFFAMLLRLGGTGLHEVLDWRRGELLQDEFQRYEVKNKEEFIQKFGHGSFAKLNRDVDSAAKSFVEQVKEKKRAPNLDERKWLPVLPHVFEILQHYRTCTHDARSTGERNTDTYLTWDYMDVYVATSMRERWEYEDTYDFLEQVFKQDSRLKKLKLRYFDPTQSYMTNRIDKGLVEGLMLRRAACTLYLAQETDTLGKDSELASTLAQGKTVIAYVPQVKNVEAHARRIAKMPLEFVRKRWLQLQADEFFALPECQRELEGRFGTNPVGGKRTNGGGLLTWTNELLHKFQLITSQRKFNLVDGEEQEIKSRLGKTLEDMCLILAILEKHYFDKRADTLRETHPLAVQVHLNDGVAYGVLVARSAKQCARLLYGRLTNDLLFSVRHSYKMTELRERISNCPYRVVTEDRKLTNSFWNFYPTSQAAL
jgi:hypothetical protein